MNFSMDSLRKYLDMLVPYDRMRWGLAAFSFFLFFVRIISCNGFYIIAYAYCIYLLLLLLAFLTPRDMMELMSAEEKDEGEPDAEFRPFRRKLSEFKAWTAVMQSTIICLFLTLFPFLDIEVYVPILVIYFIVLSYMMLKKQIEHMIRYKYVPWNIKKQKFSAPSDEKKNDDIFQPNTSKPITPGFSSSIFNEPESDLKQISETIEEKDKSKMD
ncbi:hypothetical protein PCE1_001548 [Barthelona sp. PCE]